MNITPGGPAHPGLECWPFETRRASVFAQAAMNTSAAHAHWSRKSIRGHAGEPMARAVGGGCEVVGRGGRRGRGGAGVPNESRGV